MIRERAHLQEVASALAEKLRVDDPDLLQRVVKLGVTRETGAAILMAPLWVTAPPPSEWTLVGVAALIAVGLLCSGVAYLPFFTLVRDIGPSRTLSVTFLVPVLGVFWGWLFLDEAVTLPMLSGAALVLGALSLVLRR